MVILASPTAFQTDSDVALPELHFPDGLPGFPGAHRFGLAGWGAADTPFRLLRSLDQPELVFVTVSPAVFFPSYAPRLDDETLERLALPDADEAVILVIVTVGERAVESTANLLAPVVINTRTREAAQVVLVGSRYDLRTPLCRP